MKVSINLSELATHIGAKVEGNLTDDLLVTGVATLSGAGKQEVSFFANSKYRKELLQTQAAAIILADKDRRFCKVPQLLMDNPYLGYARAVTLFNPVTPPPVGIHPTAWVSSEAVLDASVSIAPHAVIEAGAQIAADVFIGPGCVVGKGVKIGNGCQLMANVTLCTGTRLGDRVIVHPGTVIGSDGFGNANDAGKWVKVPQLGGVLVGNDVEIGANTTIDKGALEDTIIGEGARLDNLIQIAHNVHIGEHTAIAGCVGIAGSTHIGNYCLIAGGVGISGHLELVDHVHVTGGSIILQSILEPGVYSSGTPIEPNRKWHRNYHRFKHLDEIARRLQILEKKQGI